jgi:MFS transporter, DHA3 family, macrolide efflux protein
MNTKKNQLIKKQNVFLNYNFVLLFSGKIISLMGDQVYAFALSWFILDLTKSSLQMSIFLVIETLVVAIVSPFGGVFADRFNRKKILVMMDLVRGCIVIIMVILLMCHLIQIWMLYISAVILAFCGSIFSPSVSSIIPNIVTDEQLNQAVSLNQFSFTLCALTGMIISGFLYNTFGITVIFVLNAISYLISGFLELCLKIPDVVKKKIEQINDLNNNFRKILIELKEGFQYIQTNKLIYNLIIMNALYNIIVFPLGYVYFPYIFNVILKATPFQLALSTGTIFLGMMIGSMVVPFLLDKVKMKLNFCISLGLIVFSFCGIIPVLTIFSPLHIYFTNWNITFILFFVSTIIGILLMFFNIPVNIIFQRFTTDEYRGRFWGIYASITSFSLPAAILLGGFLVKAIPMMFVLILTYSFFFVLNFWITNLKAVKALKV